MTSVSGIRTAGLLAVCLTLIWSSIGCRNKELWSGARVIDDGRRYEIAAQAPLCSCLNIENKTGQPLYIQSMMHDAITGSTTIDAGGRVSQRFDWGGTLTEDSYMLTAWTTQGEQLRFGDSVVASISAFMDCATAACEFKPLMMDIGLTGRNPGER